MNDNKKYAMPFALVSLLFMLWGIANNMNDTLLAAFKRIMSMSDLQTSLVQFAFYGAYFCIALPAALFIRRYSYKSGILLGLAVYALGTMLFYPAGIAASYPFFLVAIYIMACGCAILETTANPYILAMGPRETATRRLNIAQTLNPLGAIAGILLSRMFILSELQDADAAARAGMDETALQAMQQHELSAISGTYMLIGCVLIALMVVMLLVKMPALKESGQTSDCLTNKPAGTSVLSRLWRTRRYRYGVIAQFFYVGVQTGVWSFTIRLVMAEAGCREAAAANIFLYSILAFTTFRFIFTALMKRFDPARLMTGAAMAAIVFTIIVICGHGAIAIAALVSISACMSLMFPTIYGIALDTVSPSDAKLGASGLIMAILGGALITPVQAYVSDQTDSISSSFIVPLICFTIILIYAIGVSKNNAKRS